MIVIIVADVPSQEVVAEIEDIRNAVSEDVFVINAYPPEIYLQPNVVMEEEFEGYFYLTKTVEIVNISTHPSPDS